MKKKIMVCFMITVLIVSLVNPYALFADTTVDETPPEIESIQLIGLDQVSENGFKFQAKLNLIEDGVGVESISFWFECSGNDEFLPGGRIVSWMSGKGNYLFTGEHSLEISVGNANFPVGEYELANVSIEDASGNTKSYSKGNLGYTDLFGNEIPNMKISTSNYSGIILKECTFLKTTNVDAGGKLPVRISFESSKSIGMFVISFEYKRGNTRQFVSSEIRETAPGIGKPWKSGTYIFQFPLNNEIPVGTIQINSLNICPSSGGYPGSFFPTFERDKNLFSHASIQVTKSELSTEPIELLDLNIRTKNLETPGIFKADFVVKENNNQFCSVIFNYVSSKGKRVQFYNNVTKVSKGNYHVEIPIGAFFPENEYTLESIQLGKKVIADDWMSYTYGDGIGDSVPPEIGGDEVLAYQNSALQKGNISLKSGYNITYYGSVGNAAALNQVKNLQSGQTAVLDCRKYRMASAELFRAIAKKNVNLVFVDTNVQWVFNGLKVSVSKCKNVNLYSKVSVVNGADYGYTGDTKVAFLKFADNGELPGEVEMRINYEYLSQKYKFKKEGMMLSYVDMNNNSKIEDSDVGFDPDNYYIYEVAHNSNFVLSKNKAKLGGTTVKYWPNGMKSIRITWNKLPCGDGYYIYRSTKKNSGYQKIATVKKNSSHSYTDKKVKAGVTYYYKVKPFSKVSSFNKTAKLSKPCAGTIRLVRPTFYNILRTNKKKTITLNWTKISGASKYYVYRSTSKNGKYKKIGETKNKTYVDKTVKRGKTYYYKLQAIHKNKKYNSPLSLPTGLKL